MILNGITKNGIGKIEHVLKHSYGKCVMGDFGKNLYEGSIWNGYRDVLSFILHKSALLHFVHHGTKFYNICIKYEYRNKLMMMWVLLNQKRRLEIFIIQNISRLIEI